MTTYMVRIYGDDPQAGPGALLEEHDFTSEAEARTFMWTCSVTDRDARVTFNGTEVGRFAVKAAEHDWTWTYSGITRADADAIAAQLTAHGHQLWVAEPA